MLFMKKILIILTLAFALNSCSTLSDINESVKGDGVPYIPGI